MRKRVKTGDIIEITTKKGLAYAQYTHEHSKPPRYGSLVRVLPGFYQTRPNDFSEIAKLTSTFQTFFPLRTAVNQKVVTIVANEPIPIEERKFPVFRGGNPDFKTGKINVWWFWNGKKEWRVGKITEEQKKMPICEVVNDTMFIKMVESGYTPETDV